MAAVVGSVLITGCSSGIGQALALEFRRRGLTVYATGRRLADLAGLRQAGIHTLSLDVCRPGDIEALPRWLAQRGAVVDLLINNAGYGQMGALSDLSSQALRDQFDTNVFGLLAVTQALLPAMIGRRQGRIVNLGSLSGILVTPFSGAYCASKSAVHALSDALRIELAPFGIRVITVQAGAVRSRFGDRAIASVGTTADAIPERSPYRPVADAIIARAGVSQASGPTSADVFARRLADAVLVDRPAAVLRIGRGSRIVPLLQRWVPRRWMDVALSRRFGLTRLNRVVSPRR